MLEAMASGVPGVCFKSGALQEVVVDQQTGLVCDEETPGAFCRAIARFLDDIKFRDECGTRAKQRFQEHYSRSMIKRLWLSLLIQDEVRSSCM
jgi:glycosyltransferase involved in cell wall biosynthesis